MTFFPASQKQWIRSIRLYSYQIIDMYDIFSVWLYLFLKRNLNVFSGQFNFSSNEIMPFLIDLMSTFEHISFQNSYLIPLFSYSFIAFFLENIDQNEDLEKKWRCTTRQSLYGSTLAGVLVCLLLALIVIVKYSSSDSSGKWNVLENKECNWMPTFGFLSYAQLFAIKLDSNTKYFIVFCCSVTYRRWRWFTIEYTNQNEHRLEAMTLLSKLFISKM